MAKPFVSVLIDTYNHERFIEEAIVSVLEQDFPAADREIIVVDDGSSDQTPEIVRTFEPQVRVLWKENGGQASAFNAGIPECKGEIVAFLDGDDWWAPGKLEQVCRALAEDQEIGLVGHGITEVYTDGREHTELLRETPRFRIDSETGALAFRLRKSFLGTSRMTFRTKVLRRIGPVPEALRIEADEYLFTLGAVLADVLILREALTFYRLHESNAFQVTNGNMEALRRKHGVLATLAESLRNKLMEMKLPKRTIGIVVDSVQTESDLIRLTMENGWPLETLRAELRNYGIVHEHASAPRWAFKCLTLIPACILPSQIYYSLRNRVSGSGLYKRARKRWLPSPEPAHVDRHRTTRP
ncbi:MAG TPA: glycosyltransferase [Candidatus Acidoferrum sp.]|nr:glycosyltransferase [Candidatus Acidoferrum sp.]